MAITEMQAASWEARDKKPMDMVLDNVPLLMYMKAAGRVKTISGGRVFWEPALIAQNGYVQRIDPTEPITMGWQPVLTDFEYAPKIMVTPILINVLEEAQNAGEGRFLDLYNTREGVAESSTMNNIEYDLQGDGTAFGGKGFNGIKTYVVDNPALGSYGGVSRVSNTSIRNTSVNFLSTFGSATDSSNIEARIRYLKNRLIRNDGQNKYMGLFGETYFNAGADSMSAKQRITKDDGLMKAGFDNYQIEGVTAVLAAGKVFSGLSRIAADRGYVLNVANFALKTYTGYNMEPLRKRTSYNQLVDAGLLLTIGQFTCNGAALSGVGFDS